MPDSYEEIGWMDVEWHGKFRKGQLVIPLGNNRERRIDLTNIKLTSDSFIFVFEIEAEVAGGQVSNLKRGYQQFGRQFARGPVTHMDDDIVKADLESLGEVTILRKGHPDAVVLSA